MLCNQCPRKCNIDRSINNGFCGTGEMFRVSRAAPHYWEEPCISGTKGSGTVFFSGCNLKCVFCQNYKISHDCFGTEITEDNLLRIFDNLIDLGVHNINLVTPSHYSVQLASALEKFRSPVPIVYNTSSYENIDTLKRLEGLIDIYLPDIKYYDDSVAVKYSKAQNYFKIASEAVLEMFRQVGSIKLNEEGIALKGVIVRHLVLPGNISQTTKIFSWVRENLPPETYISIMSQYTPYGPAKDIYPINRKLSGREYKIVKDKILSLGFENCYFQKLNSATESYIPDFNLEGVDLYKQK